MSLTIIFFSSVEFIAKNKTALMAYLDEFEIILSINFSIQIKKDIFVLNMI